MYYCMPQLHYLIAFNEFRAFARKMDWNKEAESHVSLIGNVFNLFVAKS